MAEKAAFFEVGALSFVLFMPPDFFEAILLGGSGLQCLKLTCWGARLQHSL
jgi:hypothetical protein